MAVAEQEETRYAEWVTTLMDRMARPFDFDAAAEMYDVPSVLSLVQRLEEAERRRIERDELDGCMEGMDAAVAGLDGALFERARNDAFTRGWVIGVQMSRARGAYGTKVDDDTDMTIADPVERWFTHNNAKASRFSRGSWSEKLAATTRREKANERARGRRDAIRARTAGGVAVMEMSHRQDDYAAGWDEIMAMEECPSE